MTVKNKAVVRVCLCGTGRIGAVHFENIILNPRFQLVALVEPVEDRRTDFARRGGCKGYATIEEALADEEENPFDAVLVCTPTDTHTDVLTAALSAGKHCFCEKPVAKDIPSVIECYKLAKSKGVHLLCGFQRRHDPSFSSLNDELKKGTVGRLCHVKTTSRDHPVPAIEFLRTSGGIFHDCASHDLDVLRWLTGEDPVTVYATGYGFNPEIRAIPDYDSVIVVLSFPSGATGVIDIARKAPYGYDQRIEVLGEEGMVSAENIPRTSVVVGSSKGFASAPVSYSFPQRYGGAGGAYFVETDHFADLVLGIESTPKVQLEDVVKNIILAHACDESIAKGAVVTIDYSLAADLDNL